jgi:catechol 2,3-dioxygenase-like lactoylglutathione lyase family enzyme
MNRSVPRPELLPNGKYDVGGVLLDRPFKIRRLGHFGFSAKNLNACLDFYNQDIGFKVTDPMDFAANPVFRGKFEGIEDTRQYFMRHGTDHHSFVLADRRVVDVLYASRPHKPVHSVNQLTWQVGSLQEVVDAISFFENCKVPINRAGRDMPGSNWHVYPFDPELHRNELYYGIEQIGWNGKGKPAELYSRGFHDAPDLPQISEEEEVARAEASGVNLNTGYLQRESMPSIYNVDGVLLPRPFKVIRIGPVGLYVDDLEAVRRFYTDIMGLSVTCEISYAGGRCCFLRCNTEHHSLALYSSELRDIIGTPADTTCMIFGLQVANYRQLCAAVAFLEGRGRRLIELPGELFPGIDYAACVVDPDGVRVVLYYSMQQVCGEGTRSPPHLSANTCITSWPRHIVANQDVYTGEVYLGPWG